MLTPMNWPRLSVVLSLAAAAIGGLSLAGWIWDIEILKRVHPAWVTMKANTAVCLMLAGIAVALIAGERRSAGMSRFAKSCAAFMAVIGALTLGEHVWGWDPGIDQALFTESVESAGRSFPGRMGPAAAVIFMLLGSAIFLLDSRLPAGTSAAQGCVLAAMALDTFIFLGYFYRVELPAGLVRYVSIALPAFLAFLLLGVALLFARPNRGLVSIFLADDPGGAMARRLLPAALWIPALSGWLFVMGREVGLYGKGVAAALLAGFVTLVFTWLIWLTSKAISGTDRRRRAAEDKLRRSERQLADFFDNAAVALHWVGPDGTVLRVNDTELKMLGYTREEYLGRHISRFHADEESLNVLLSRLTAGEVITDYPAKLRRKDGTVRDVMIHSSVYRENGEFIHTRCFTRDVTDLAQSEAALKETITALAEAKERAEKASRAKDEFLAALSHELRTPLTPVLLLAAEREGDRELPDKVRADFATIRKNIDLEARIIDDLLDVTRITNGKLELRMAVVDVEELIGDALQILAADCHARGLTVERKATAASTLVHADAVRLEQVLWNVLKNAIKFTPAGGRIEITSSSADGEVHVTVQDSGMGITREELPLIFTAFAQGRETSGAVFGGLGLGLSISALLMKMLGGRIWAESEGRHQGSTFHITLPLAADTAVNDRPSQAMLPGVLPSTPSLRILLVEDHQDSRTLLASILRRWGHDVTDVDTVAAARREIPGGHYNLLLSDIGLPDGTGYDVIAAWLGASSAPAIAMSGYGTPGDFAKSAAAGFNHHVVKPVSTEPLKEVLRTVYAHGAIAAAALA